MSELPPQLRDRSISINHNGVVIIWIPRDQLVPASTRYTDTTAGPPPSSTPPQNTFRSSKKKAKKFSTTKPKSKSKQRQKQKSKPTPNPTPLREARSMSRLTLIQRLKAFWSSTPKATKAVITGGPPLRRKGGIWDLWGRNQCSKPARGRGRRRRSSSTRNDSRFARLACDVCKKKAARDERARCFNYLCRGCGEDAVSVVRGDRGFCEDCAGVEASGRKVEVEEGASPLDGPSVLREIEVLRVGGEIEASSTSGSNHSTDAVIDGDTETGRNRFDNERSLKTRRRCRKLKLPALSCDRDRGNVMNDGDGIEISSDDSLAWVSVYREPVEFCAAQIGSPRGLAQSFWPSSSPRARETANAGSFKSSDLEQPKMYRRRSEDLLSALEDAIRTPICSPKHGHGITVSPNSPDDQGLQSIATSRPNAISKRRFEFGDQISELDVPHAHTATWHESPPSPHWMELLEHPSSPSSSGQSLLAPPPLVIEQPRTSMDSYYSIPQSLADSEFCSELIRILSTIPKRSEWPKDSRATTPSPISPYLSHLLSEVSRKAARYSLESEPKESHAPTASPQLFDSTYFEQEQQLHPHPHLPREPSPAFTPYPSLNSSAASLEVSFRPTLETWI